MECVGAHVVDTQLDEQPLNQPHGLALVSRRVLAASGDEGSRDRDDVVHRSGSQLRG
jgi:hypothetical protein